MTRALALLWPPLYAALQLFWTLGTTPGWARGTDLVLPPWIVIPLCAATPLIVAASWATGGTVLLVAAAWAVTALLGGAAAMLLLDLVGVILPGLGIPTDPLGALSRIGCLGVAILAGATALRFQRRVRGCTRCSRIPALLHTPAWAYTAAYVAIAGFAVRAVAQFTLIDAVPYDGGLQLAIFEIGFVLAGVLLPLALVHGFGRIWPRWVPPLAGRRVPRWLVLGAGVLVSVALCGYFGMGLVQLTLETVRGIAQEVAFMWVAVPGYVVWGLGVAGATWHYYRRTKRGCVVCGV
ncbi:hypothetical protein [Nonomuraea typhae]|uniref:hypothetical protein n=1 Tax=Nonomuraea typhae TaxID=2603600 RepID=UPI0012FB5F78|nr:hypothetical protein [Nonomuraea typhae]